MKIEKLLQKAINSPQKLRFNEFKNLLTHYGFLEIPQDGTSHIKFVQKEFKRMMVIQEGKDGCSKVYQVKQFLKVLEENNVI